MVKQKQYNSQLLNVNLRVFVVIGLTFLLFYPPFLRGLFFAPELLITHMFTAVLFAICWYDKLLHRDVTFLKGSLDYSALAFVIVYVLSLYGAVNMRGAIGELLKVINYFMVYWITAQTVKSERDIKILYRSIFFSAVGVACVGIGAAAGLVDYPGAVVEGKIYSTLQYPNTTATLLALGTFLGFGLLNASHSRLGKVLYASGNMLMMAVIVASGSRGSWMLYPLVLALFVIGLPRKRRFSTFYSLAITLGIGLQLARVLQLRNLGGTDHGVFKYLVLWVIITAAAQWVYDGIIRWLDEREVRANIRKLLAAGVIAYALILGIVYIEHTTQAVPSVVAQFVPSGTLERAGTINNQDTSIVARIDFTMAALKMASDYPVNGLGGEGWNALYHRYMPYLKYSSETHNYPAKVLVETGFIGLLILFVIWFFWTKGIYKLWRTELEDDSWVLIWAAAMAGTVLLVHSMYDFDLSLGAMGIILWTLCGVIRAAENVYISTKEPTKCTRKRVMTALVGGTLGASLLFMSAIILFMAGENGADGARAMINRNWVEAEKRLLKAVQLDPFSASYSADLAQVYAIKWMASNDSNQMALSARYAEKAVRNEPYNFGVRLRLLMIALVTGNVERAVKDAESLVAQNPLDVHNFEILGKIYIASGRYYSDKGQKDKAELYWRRAGDIKRQLDIKIRNVNKIRGWDGDLLQITPVVNLYMGEAAYLLGDFARADVLLNGLTVGDKKVPDQLVGEALLYRYATKAKQGDMEYAQAEIKKLAAIHPGIDSEFDKLLLIRK